jgi:hypothetical protein
MLEGPEGPIDGEVFDDDHLLETMTRWQWARLAAP